MTKEIKDKDIVEYYGHGKNIQDADALLLKTAENNFEKGYVNAQEKILKMINERRITLLKEVKLYKDEARGDRELELDYLEEQIITNTQIQTNTKVVEK